MELTIKVVCESLPGAEFADTQGGARLVRRGIHLGIQRGDEVIAAVAADRARAVFEPVFRVTERAGGRTNFLGPFAKGTPDERYFYLSWLARDARGEMMMFRRAKVHLSHLPWSAVSGAVAAGIPATVRLSLTDGRGGPRCGSIREREARWQL